MRRLLVARRVVLPSRNNVVGFGDNRTSNRIQEYALQIESARDKPGDNKKTSLRKAMAVKQFRSGLGLYS